MSAIQWLSFIAVINIIWIEVVWMRKTPSRNLVSIPTLAWMVHAVVFYMALLVDPSRNYSDYSTWSSILRLHGFITLLMLGIYKIWGWRKIT